MRMVEIRRHSIAKKGDERTGGAYLSHAGVDLARTVGEAIARPDLVLASTLPRALETAVAFGFAVDDQFEVDQSSWGGIGGSEWLSWSEPFVEARALVAKGGPPAEAAEACVRVWLEALTRVPDGGRALVVSHGGVIELGLVAAVPDADHASWGGMLAECEGAELDHDGTRFTDVRFHRLG